MDKSRNIDEIKSRWKQEADKYVLKAATDDLGEYPLEVQEIIKNEAIKRGLVESSNQMNFQKNDVLNSIKISWADVPSEVKNGFFCPECKQVYLNNENECEKCNINLESLGYCMICGKFWKLPPQETCPKDGSILKDKRLTAKENLINVLKNVTVCILGFGTYLLTKEIYGGWIFILFFGILLCGYFLNKILPDNRKPLLWAISIQAGYYLFFLITSIFSGHIFYSSLFESLLVFSLLTWLALKPSIYPATILTSIHILSLLAISLSVFSVIVIDDLSPTYKGLILNIIIRIPSIVLMYKGLGEIKKNEKAKGCEVIL